MSNKLAILIFATSLTSLAMQKEKLSQLPNSETQMKYEPDVVQIDFKCFMKGDPRSKQELIAILKSLSPKDRIELSKPALFCNKNESRFEIVHWLNPAERDEIIKDLAIPDCCD